MTVVQRLLQDLFQFRDKALLKFEWNDWGWDWAAESTIYDKVRSSSVGLMIIGYQEFSSLFRLRKPFKSFWVLWSFMKRSHQSFRARHWSEDRRHVSWFHVPSRVGFCSLNNTLTHCLWRVEFTGFKLASSTLNLKWCPSLIHAVVWSSPLWGARNVRSSPKSRRSCNNIFVWNLL